MSSTKYISLAGNCSYKTRVIRSNNNYDTRFIVFIIIFETH